ncbi:MAG: DEAD/DEAH box helicase family protein [Spirochaetales bacterium]|nr:DEAD/DEAH box helicase family protein [Spirochaetales bacterium]
MTYKDIIQYVDRLIFERGLNYFQNGQVLDFRKINDVVIASVKGSFEKQYDVHITLSPEGKVLDSHCTCPYWDRCKHVAAVLIFLMNGSVQNDARAVMNPLREYEGKHSQSKIINLSSLIRKRDRKEVYNLFHNAYARVDALKSIFGKRHFIEPDKEYRLVFVVNVAALYTEFDIGSADMIPGLQYIKKDGTFGKIYSLNDFRNYNHKSDEEIYLLNRILTDRKGKGYIPFSNYIDYILDNHEKLTVFLRLASGDVPLVSFHPIRATTMKFILKDIRKEAVFFRPEFRFFIDGVTCVSSRPRNCFVFRYGILFVLITDRGQVVYNRIDKYYTEFVSMFLNEVSVLDPDEIDYITSFVNNYLKDSITIDFRQKVVRLERELPKSIIELNLSRTSDGDLSLKLFFNYGGMEAGYSENIPLFVKEDLDEEVVAIKREDKFEKDIAGYLSTLLKDRIVLNNLHVSGKLNQLRLNMTFPDFLKEFGRFLLDEGFELRAGGNKRLSRNSGTLAYEVKNGIDWFDLQVSLLDEEGNLRSIDIEGLDRELGLLKTDTGYIFINSEDLEKIILLKDEGLNDEGRLKVSRLDFDLLSRMYPFLSPEGKNSLDHYLKLYLKLSDIREIPSRKVPSGFKGKLRHYQEQGFNWLLFLNEHGINGLLADDMGLGKTVQTLACLQSLKESGSLGVVLIVVPVTTLANWESEIERFTPGLKVIRHSGTARVKDPEFLKTHDIVLVSYQTLRNDVTVLGGLEVDYLILDESQNIKNVFTKTHGAIRMLEAKHKLCLTGTPIENSTLELWAQMDFLNPGLLGTLDEFKNRFMRSIELSDDEMSAERLKKIVSPLILKRTKGEVVKELPPKEVIVQYIEMEDNQREAYNKLKEKYRALVAGSVKQNGIRKSMVEIFTALLRLRQMALFPEIADRQFLGVASAKMEYFKEMLDEILDENHKILVFSQFVSVLRRLEDYLKSQNLKYSYLDGSTRHRKEQIKQFQEDPETRIFLLSLKAGGIGINLTAGDYVILFDPWWNPAVEMQAIDRTHRIGQKKKVIAYKFIMKETVEEKIIKLQERKLDLVTRIVTGDRGVLAALSEEELMSLFS